MEADDGRTYRIEGAHRPASDRTENSGNIERPESPEPEATAAVHADSAEVPQQNRQQVPPQPILRQDQADSGIAGPHWKFDLQHEITRSESKSHTNWSAALSQLLAYTGVGVLTIGTACVIWGYFGGIANYLPLGWLTVTFGQMLLFLGLITHVSNGIESLQQDVETQFGQLHRRLGELNSPRSTSERSSKHPQ